MKSILPGARTGTHISLPDASRCFNYEVAGYPLAHPEVNPAMIHQEILYENRGNLNAFFSLEELRRVLCYYGLWTRALALGARAGFVKAVVPSVTLPVLPALVFFLLSRYLFGEPIYQQLSDWWDGLASWYAVIFTPLSDPVAYTCGALIGLLAYTYLARILLLELSAGLHKKVRIRKWYEGGFGYDPLDRELPVPYSDAMLEDVASSPEIEQLCKWAVDNMEVTGFIPRTLMDAKTYVAEQLIGE